MNGDAITELEETGRVWFRNALDADVIAKLRKKLPPGNRPGFRLAMDTEWSRLIARVNAIAQSLGFDSEPVRMVSFDKSPVSNWAVAWHQDRVVALAERREAPGYSNWVRKDDFWHCEAPVALLQSLIFARLHLDEATLDNGALELALGSHLEGFVAARDASQVASRYESELCEAAPGDVLFVKALTLHRSASSINLSRRRALRLDYAKRQKLHSDLRWAY